VDVVGPRLRVSNFAIDSRVAKPRGSRWAVKAAVCAASAATRSPAGPWSVRNRGRRVSGHGLWLSDMDPNSPARRR